MSSRLDVRLALLRDVLRGLQPGLIAVSGGIDSRFLLQAAWSWELAFHGAYATGAHQSPGENERALTWLKQQRGPGHVVEFSPLDLPALRINPRMRCYHCKHALFSRLKTLAADLSCAAVLDGTQKDDLHRHRPGLRALRELGVHSPLALAGLGKTDIRQAAEQRGLADPQQPARPCLLTRFAYDQPIVPEQLAAVGAAEDDLALLGLRRFRLRIAKNEILLLQIHSDEERLWESIGARGEAVLAALGLPLAYVQFTTALSGFFDKE